IKHGFANENSSEFLTIDHDVDQLVKEIVKNSYEASKFEADILSKKHLLSSSENYYVPKVTISASERKYLEGYDGLKSEISATGTAKLWGDTVSYNIASNHENLNLSIIDYNLEVTKTYRNVINNLIKLKNSKKAINQLRNQSGILDDIVEEISTSGVLKKSDKNFAIVTKKKSEELILSIESRVETYINNINNISPKYFELYNFIISDRLSEIELKINEDNFDTKSIVRDNLDIQRADTNIRLGKNNVKSLNEIITINLETQHKRSSNTGYDKPNSYIGLGFYVDLFDYSNYKVEKSEEELLIKAYIDRDRIVNQYVIRSDSLKKQYSLLEDTKGNLLEQLDLSESIFLNLKNEINVDESNILDLLKNVSTRMDGEVKLLSVNNNLSDTVMQVKMLRSIAPNKYRI
ncbi:TolC family protein, partial [Vibrio sp. 10N.261.45.A7]